MDNYLYDQSMRELFFGNATSLFYHSTSQEGHGGHLYTTAPPFSASRILTRVLLGKHLNSDQVREVVKLHTQERETGGAQSSSSGGAGFTLL